MYDLVVDGKIIKSAEKIKYLKILFYQYLELKRDVWVERDGKKIWFNGKEKII